MGKIRFNILPWGCIHILLCVEHIELFEFQFGLFLEDHQMRWTSKHEVAELISFLDLISYFNGGHTARNFNHANIDNSYFSYLRIFSFYDKYLPCGDSTQEWLTLFRWALIESNKLRLIKVVCTINVINILNDSIHWCMPPMII